MILSTFLLSFYIIIALRIRFKKRPLGLSVIVLVMAGVIAGVRGLRTSTWYSYVGFLIYVGAILIVFAYISALTPENPRGNFKISILYFLITAIVLYLMAEIYWGSNNINESILNPTGKYLLLSPELELILPIGCILFLAILGATKICRVQGGPLRQFKGI